MYAKMPQNKTWGVLFELSAEKTKGSYFVGVHFLYSGWKLQQKKAFPWEGPKTGPKRSVSKKQILTNAKWVKIKKMSKKTHFGTFSQPKAYILDLPLSGQNQWRKKLAAFLNDLKYFWASFGNWSRKKLGGSPTWKYRVGWESNSRPFNLMPNALPLIHQPVDIYCFP